MEPELLFNLSEDKKQKRFSFIISVDDCLLTSKPSNYALLSNGDVIVDSINDVEQYQETRQCMDVLNFSSNAERTEKRYNERGGGGKRELDIILEGDWTFQPPTIQPPTFQPSIKNIPLYS